MTSGNMNSNTESYTALKAQTRNTNDDCIRILAMIMVIMIHNNWEDLITEPWIHSICLTFISVCNCFFFMLSGKYNLRTEFKNGVDVITYYKKRAIDILFPYVLISLIISIINYLNYSEPPLTLKYCFLNSMKDLFSANAMTHLWFMYPLMGFILSTPFLSRMLHSMSDSELHLLMIVGFVWNAVTIMFMNTHHDFSYSGWLMSGWIIYYIAGYYFDRVSAGDRGNVIVKRYIVAGAVGYIVNVSAMVLLPDNYFYGGEYTVPFMLFAYAFWLILEHKIHIFNSGLVRCIGYVVRHSFTIYLIHFTIKDYLFKYISFEPVALQYFVRVILTFVISLVISIPVDFILGICRNNMKKALL